jgi:hypothetical protein
MKLIMKEVPEIDGINFKLKYPALDEMVFVDGILQEKNIDYIINENIISSVVNFSKGSRIRVTYIPRS